MDVQQAFVGLIIYNRATQVPNWYLVVQNCDVILVFSTSTSQIEFGGTYENSFGTYGSKYQIWYLARLPTPHTEGHFGHLDTCPFWQNDPTDTQITVTYVSSHFAEKHMCLHNLPYAEV